MCLADELVLAGVLLVFEEDEDEDLVLEVEVELAWVEVAAAVELVILL